MLLGLRCEASDGKGRRTPSEDGCRLDKSRVRNEDVSFGSHAGNYSARGRCPGCVTREDRPAFILESLKNASAPFYLSLIHI